ncbi:MAG TPA: S8 family serine peptidase, partial [Thermoanaerobaculia bacterium]
MKRVLALLLLFVPAAIFALPLRGRGESRHMILTAEHTLLDEDRAELARLGCNVVRALGGREYLVHIGARGADDVARSTAVAALRPIDPEEKVFTSARREAMQLRRWAALQILFHEDVVFRDAAQLIHDLGGEIDDPRTTRFAPPHRLAVRLPNERLPDLAKRDEVFQIHGPFGRISAMNQTAAVLSSVAELHAAPYDLRGAGVVVAVMDIDSVDVSHTEFESRVTGNANNPTALHPTHVTGTIAARGTNADAKGMAPGVLVQSFAYSRRFLEVKEEDYPRLGVRADNNSIGFVIGWSFASERTHQWEWWGDEDFGAYSVTSAAVDAIARRTNIIMAWAAGNHGDERGPNPASSPFLPHYHQAGVADDPTVFCTSVNGSGTDCPSIPCQRCERTGHPPDGPFRNMSDIASAKNVLAVGAVSGASKDDLGRPVIASFSSRGPTRDGRIKPDLVAKGTFQLSTANGGGYMRLQGTSMATPVITGINALVLEQWEKTMGAAPTDPATFRALLLNSADDLGVAGPDYIYGFGIANAKRTIDTIVADGGTGLRMRRESVGQGVMAEYPLALAAAGDVKVTLAWNDPENAPFAAKALINDLDLKLIDAGGGEILPYVLDPATPDAAATPGVNTVDSVEQIEVRNAAVGNYKIRVVGK